VTPPPRRTIPAPTLAHLADDLRHAHAGRQAARETYLRTEAAADLATLDQWVRACRQAAYALATAIDLLKGRRDE
jgi:hypothetical protein